MPFNSHTGCLNLFSFLLLFAFCFSFSVLQKIKGKREREVKRTFNRITSFNYYLRLRKSEFFFFFFWIGDYGVLILLFSTTKSNIWISKWNSSNTLILFFFLSFRCKRIFPFGFSCWTWIAMFKVYSLFIQSYVFFFAWCTVNAVYTIVNLLIVYKWWSEQEKRFSRWMLK